jgi:hypothetical protein
MLRSVERECYEQSSSKQKEMKGEKERDTTGGIKPEQPTWTGLLLPT